MAAFRRDDLILEGKPIEHIPDCSLAEYLLQKMRALPKDGIIQIDADTGDVQTVKEFLEMSIGLSEGLKKQGLAENDVVSLMSRNCFESSAVVLATWLSGAAVSPTDGNMKMVEMKHVLKLGEPKFIFCEEEMVENVMSSVSCLSVCPEIVVVDKPENSNRSHATNFRDLLLKVDIDTYKPQPVASPSTQLVVIQFSSGSTGLPKGIGLTHRNLIFQDLSMELSSIIEGTNLLQISQFYWVTGALIFLRSLSSGAARVLTREATTPNILKAIQKYKCDFTIMGPALASAIVTSPEFDSYDVTCMKKIALGGAPLTPSMIEKLQSKWASVWFCQAFGTTECSGIISNCSSIDDDRLSVGKVSPGIQMKVVDPKTGESLKSETLGEICARSPGIMKGYIKNDKATREAVDLEGWCHTGDLGYYTDSGNIYIVDRIKEMIKIMNHQVSPTEVENTILSLPGVAEVAVAAVSSDDTFYKIMALVVKTSDSTVTEEEIQSHVANTLSDYKKLTAGVYFVKSIPKTTTFKFDRKKIKEMAHMFYSGSTN